MEAETVNGEALDDQYRTVFCIRAAGRSMHPTIHDGDMIVLDRTSTEPIDGQPFVLRTGAGVVVSDSAGAAAAPG